MIEIHDGAFDIAVTGFDANRDLYLDAKLREGDSNGQSVRKAKRSLFDSDDSGDE